MGDSKQDATVTNPRAPVRNEHWRVVDVPGGWLRYNRALGRLDAHCGAHLGSCKMDRSLRKGCIGLNLSWLQCSAENKTDHNVSKWRCSDSTGFEARHQLEQRACPIPPHHLGAEIECCRELLLGNYGLEIQKRLFRNQFRK